MITKRTILFAMIGTITGVIMEDVVTSYEFRHFLLKVSKEFIEELRG